MNRYAKFVITLIAAFALSACGGSSDSDTNDNGARSLQNTLILNGDDTASLSTELVLAEFYYHQEFANNPEKLIATSVDYRDLIIFTSDLSGTTTTDVSALLDDNVLLTITPIGISMLIYRNEEPWSYSLACTGSSGFSADCESINFNSSNRIITFSDTLVEPSTSSFATAPLTINGTITWLANEEGNDDLNIDDDDEFELPTREGPLTDITGTWLKDGSNYWVDTDFGTSSEIFVIYRQDNTYTEYVYFPDVECFDFYSGTYDDFGSGNFIFDDDAEEYENLIIDGNTMRSYPEPVSTAERSDRLESSFTPICDLD